MPPRSLTLPAGAITITITITITIIIIRKMANWKSPGPDEVRGF